MIPLIPKPVEMIEKDTFSHLRKNGGVFFDSHFEKSRQFFFEFFPFLEEKEGDSVQISFDASLAREAYRLKIENHQVKLSASDGAGLFYGFESLRQIIFFSKKENDSLLLPDCAVFDRPRYGFRSMHLDEARHFFGMKTVKRLLDFMALYKLNTFHWHLTDDQGWRIEIKKYPRLTEIGAYRRDSAIGGWKQFQLEGKPHGGYYTQEEIREIVDYAAKRHIQIIPEIDMPAHFTAAFAAYPHLACREIPVEVAWHFGGKTPKLAGIPDWNRSACIGKESTFDFVFDCLEKIFDLFPAPYFHIGGDEAPKQEWEKCSYCQKRMKENHLATTEDLQGYFNNRVNEFAKKHGKKLIVWNEALAAKGLDHSVIGQYWTPKWDENVNPYLAKGGQLIVCKHQACYFDMPYAQYPLWNTYQFDPVKHLIPKKYENQILGIEGLLWTEWVSTQEKMDMQIFPRLLALAEISWTEPEKKNFRDFLARLSLQERLLDDLGVNYAEKEIALPRSYFQREKGIHRWYFREQDAELRKNNQIKAQKKK